MTELQGKKRRQPSSPVQRIGYRPLLSSSWSSPAGRNATHNAAWASARFVYNRTVANDQAGRDAGLWLTPHELEKEFNAAKQVNPALAFVTEVSKFVAQGACRNYRNATRPLDAAKASRPASRCSTRRKVLAPVRSWPLQAVATVHYDGTIAVSGCPTWAA